MQSTTLLSHYIYMFDWLILRQDFSAGGGWRVRGSGWWVTGDGWRVTGGGLKNLWKQR